MTEILVNKSELKNIRDDIDKILRKQSITIRPQYSSYESEELSEREKEILKYVEKNPGATKEDVIKKNQHIGSRMTIVNATEGLIQKNILIVKRGLNQHVQPLYTNKEHLVLSLFNDFEFFKEVYFRLIDETNKNLKKLWIRSQKKSDVGRYMLMWQLLEALLMPYKNMIMIYIMSDLLLWQERPLDKHTLHNKFAVVYDSLKEIHTKLHESITPLFNSEFYRDLQMQPLDSSLYDVQPGLKPKQVIDFLRVYWGYGLGAFVEPVLDILWKISYPVLPHIELFYASIDREKLKDWRNIIKGNEEFNYIPKTTQAENLGKLLR